MGNATLDVIKLNVVIRTIKANCGKIVSFTNITEIVGYKGKAPYDFRKVSNLMFIYHKCLGLLKFFKLFEM